jgi:hypothetical protein
MVSVTLVKIFTTRPEPGCDFFHLLKNVKKADGSDAQRFDFGGFRPAVAILT